MSNKVFRIKKGDTSPSLAIALTQKSTGLAMNLTGATAIFYMRLKTDPTGTPKINGVAVDIYDETNGKARYNWTTGDVDTSDLYLGEFEFTLDGKVFTIPQSGHIEILIEDEIG